MLPHSPQSKPASDAQQQFRNRFTNRSGSTPSTFGTNLYAKTQRCKQNFGVHKSPLSSSKSSARNFGKKGPAQYVQRVSALEAELHLKDTELQNEMQRVDLLSTSIQVQREELQKKGTGATRSAQLSVDGRLSGDSRRVPKYV